MKTFVLNGWAATARAWERCSFRRDRIFSYLEQLDGEPERVLAGTDRFALVGWSMGGSSALRLACRFPDRVRALVLVAATPRMMEERRQGWRGMSPRRLEALRYGLVATGGRGLFGLPEGWPNPYDTADAAALERGIGYLRETDVRGELERVFAGGAPFPVRIFQSERDGVVRPENAGYLGRVFPHAVVTTVPGSEHALPLAVPELIDAAMAELAGGDLPSSVTPGV